ncbi:CTSL [Cordylochernes scorpioides]|uniref:CTSL n=1 Tax=Cordylochernes scorpioides TaxID=51811 RepID=A0ABY6K1A1_9ARAC|nr:CTSL [Cordylochernes scorpioides]
MQELHGKNYQGLEDQVRKAIFEEKLKKIVQHNLEYDLGMQSYYLGINKYSDWSSQEFTKHMSRLIVSEDRTMDLYEPSGDMELPSSLDWRSKGYVTGVKDQGRCAICWAFSTTGALEGQHYGKSGKLVSLSEQNLKNPILTWLNKLWLLWDKSPSALTQVEISIMYKGGVYNNPDCGNDIRSQNHGVLLVGYRQENGIDYWLVKNSWTEWWGEKGYIKMSRNKNNQCGIATYATYPIV